MFYSRKSPRMKNYDYSTPTAYFITICTHEKVCLFGQPDQLNEFGSIAKDEILSLSHRRAGIHMDHFVVMPNHVHMLLTIHFDQIKDQQYPDVSAIIGSYKAGVSRRIHEIDPTVTIWQRSFHDHVIRTEGAWQKIWKYIDENPYHWDEDCYRISFFCRGEACPAPTGYD